MTAWHLFGLENSRDDDVFVPLQDVARLRFVVDLADRVGELGGGQVRGPGKISASDRGDGFSALGGVDFGAWRGYWLRFGDRRFGRNAGRLELAGVLFGYGGLGRLRRLGFGSEVGD